MKRLIPKHQIGNKILSLLKPKARASYIDWLKSHQIPKYKMTTEEERAVIEAFQKYKGMIKDTPKPKASNMTWEEYMNKAYGENTKLEDLITEGAVNQNVYIVNPSGSYNDIPTVIPKWQQVQNRSNELIQKRKK